MEIDNAFKNLLMNRDKEALVDNLLNVQERCTGYALETVYLRKREQLLVSYIRECLPYVKDMVGIASSARILEEQINDILSDYDGGLTQRVPDAANVCRVVKHVYVDGTCAECGSPEPQRR